MLRGRNEGILALDLEVDPETTPGQGPAQVMVRAALKVGGKAPGDLWLSEVAGWAWRVKLRLSLTLDLMG